VYDDVVFVVGVVVVVLVAVVLVEFEHGYGSGVFVEWRLDVVVGVE